MRFICDDNLGRLAKYLRILGFDTFFQEPISDPELMRLASAQERFLLTRDHHLLAFSNPYGILLLEDNEPLQQLLYTVQSLNLTIEPKNLFERCSRCNKITVEVNADQTRNSIFPYILKSQKVIKKCPSCGRYYWKGSHHKRLLEDFKNTIPANALSGPWPEG